MNIAVENPAFAPSEHGITANNIPSSTPETVLSHNDQHLTHTHRHDNDSDDQVLRVIIHIINRPYCYCFYIFQVLSLNNSCGEKYSTDASARQSGKHRSPSESLFRRRPTLYGDASDCRPRIAQI